VDDDLVEMVALALFEADEDLNDKSVCSLVQRGYLDASALGRRAVWDEPGNSPRQAAFRYKAEKAIDAMMRIGEGRFSESIAGKYR
jgi:hypothetical protein